MKIEDIKCLDVIKGLSIVANNAVVYQKLLKSFVSNPFCDQLLDAINSGDKELIKQKAHSLKGVSGNMHMPELYQLCCMIEADAIEGIPLSSADDKVIQLVDINRQTLESVNMLLENPDLLNELG